MEDFIRCLASDLAAKLDQLEKETNFTFLKNIDNENIANEAQLLHEEIVKLKERLEQL